MATREQIGINAGAVNAAFGTWIKFRGTPDVPPIAQTSGVSYQPAQHTLYKEFNDAFKSLPDLLKGARNTYETYWEQAKKSADDYRKGKSLDEINRELDAGEVPLQYRPLLMSALEFRQGQESMQIAAQELTTKINSGEFAEMSPMELDQATTDFMNEQLAGLQEAHGTTGGTDAFYNGYYSEVAKVRQFAQQRNDQLVEQRRQQDIQIQVQAAVNELGQNASSAQEAMDGLKALGITYNRDPLSAVQDIESLIRAAASNPNGVALINELRSMEYRDGTLEDFFTKAYFDSAQIDAANTAFLADAEKTSKYLEELDRISRNGAVGAARTKLQEALQRGGNLETKEVQYARNALLQAQHQAEADAKRKKEQADVANAMKQLSNKNGTVREVYENSESIEDAKDKLWAASTAMYNSIVMDSNPQSRQAKIEQLNSWFGELINNDYKNIGAQVVRESLPFTDRLLKLTDGDKQYIIENPHMMYSVVGEVDREISPEKYNAVVNQMNNEMEIYGSLSNNMLIAQVALQDSKAYLGHRIMGTALKGDNFQEVGLNLIRAENLAKDQKLKNAVDDMSERLTRGKPWQAEQVQLYLSTRVSNMEQLNDKGIQREALQYVADSNDYIDTSSGRLVGTPIYGDTIPVSKAYLNELRDIVTDFNGSLPEEMQFDMNFIKTGDVSRLGGYLIQDRVSTMLRNQYEKATGSKLPFAWGATQQDINSLLNDAGFSVRVDYQDQIGESGDLLISIVDRWGQTIGNMSTYLAADRILVEYADKSVADKVRLIEGGTDKSLKDFKRKVQTQENLEEFKSLYPFSKTKYLYGYEAEARKGLQAATEEREQRIGIENF